MKLRTASETISFIKKHEEGLIAFYGGVCGKLAETAEMFLSFAGESKKYIREIDRAYYSVISDAIEGCFAFDLDADEFEFDFSLPKEMTPKEAFRRAIAMEEHMLKLYETAAQQSGPLLADVPRSFKVIARKRTARIVRLKALLGGGA